ncbi:hypothetical protein [Telmatospirillum sp.]|uniref:hypothetical protein n=1 Tax=Telmatospirillum sp. TaxID=2079197 RepID=UPI00283AB937|nr:hypothetical protein [Telmatospirillum sp.]MDR3440899.1 hypothetical protein [Telmatospirillum sp.]
MKRTMGPNGRSLLTLAVVALFALGALASTAVATTTTTTAKATSAKKKAVVHKPVPRPNPLALVKKSVIAGAPTVIAIGTPTASKKALSIPSTGTAQPIQHKTISLGHALPIGAPHGLGKTVVHVAQNDIHFELKP